MHKLTSILRTMNPSNSAAADFISIIILKDAGPAINPALLHLINNIIKSGQYLEDLKLTKVVPIRKMAKPHDDSAGWRPINIVPSISKVVEKCFLKQMTDYMERNKFIHHSHHGSVKGKGTQTWSTNYMIPYWSPWKVEK